MSASLEESPKEIATVTTVKASARRGVGDEEESVRENGKENVRVRVHRHEVVLAKAGGLRQQRELQYPLGRMNGNETRGTEIETRSEKAT